MATNGVLLDDCEEIVAMEPTDNDCLRQLDSHLASGQQAWLFGAGISIGANVPLMGPLTTRVFQLAAEDENENRKKVLNAVKEELRDDANIEDVLSQLGDFAAIAERSKSQKAHVGQDLLAVTELRDLHAQVLQWISGTIRWGFVHGTNGNDDEIGTRDKPIVEAEGHAKFVSALFERSQAGVVERRGPVRIFTVNYDTLLEDALALGCVSYWDGFSGGAVAFRSHRYGENEPDSGFRAHVIKLHGSIDWHLGTDERVWRVRDGDIYPERSKRVLIYPQSTKYLATQRDPFASQFDLFRRTLSSSKENVLAICGYSFGDEHINQEIELCLTRPENKTTIVAFSRSINETLLKWRASRWAKNLYIVTEHGLYVGTEGPFSPPDEGKIRDWWTLDGVTNLLNHGAEASVQ